MAGGYNEKLRLRSDSYSRQIENDELTDAIIEGKFLYSLQEKLESSNYDSKLVQEMTGNTFNVKHVQEYGFSQPVIVKAPERESLNFKMPDESFTVSNVKQLVGARRLIDVVDVQSQKGFEMSLLQWAKYYETPPKERDRLLNVISLEFSLTKLDELVSAPSIVSELDWTETAWPRELKEAQKDATNNLSTMKYPKVQKYCLMSVNGCYTDFHVDFGGTSVWYHVFRGKKIFFLIPPTDLNLDNYKNWLMSGKQGEFFFADEVDACQRICIEEKDTFFIPSGWIHAVYTPVDSLVFGGNFLHSFAIPNQIRISNVELETKVPNKFKFPFFEEIHWYVLAKYVEICTGKSFIDHSLLNSHKSYVHKQDYGVQFLTPLEIQGLNRVIEYLKNCMVTSDKHIPNCITDPPRLMQTAEMMMCIHASDDHTISYSGTPILCKLTCSKSNQSNKSMNKTAVVKSYRVSCKKCPGCLQTECGECTYCTQQKKQGVSKRRGSCIRRKCMLPMLSSSAECSVCGGANTQSKPLMECILCSDIMHPSCSLKQGGQINSQLANSWECPTCVENYSMASAQSNNIFASLNSLSHDVAYINSNAKDAKKSKDNSSSSDTDIQDVQLTPRHYVNRKTISRKRKHSKNVCSFAEPPVHYSKHSGRSIKAPKPFWMASSASNPIECENFETSSLTVVLKSQCHVQMPADVNKRRCIRPYTPLQSEDGLCGLSGKIWIKIMSYLSQLDLISCALVCRSLGQWSVDPSLWQTIDVERSSLDKYTMQGIVRRQPVQLDLSWTNLASGHLLWLLRRLPALQTLVLCGCSWPAIAPLGSDDSPCLQQLDIRFVEGLTDSCLTSLFAHDNVPLQRLSCLKISGANVTDESLVLISTKLSHLTDLEVSNCLSITDDGVSHLISSESVCFKTIQKLKLSGCKLLSAKIFSCLSAVTSQNLLYLDIRHCPLIESEDCFRFIDSVSSEWLLTRDLLMAKKPALNV